MYYELAQHDALAIGEKKPWPYRPKNIYELLTLAADMSRFDPRLLGILVEFFELKWSEINPTILRQTMMHMDCPQTLGVIFSFTNGFLKQKEFSFYKDYVLRNLKPVEPQLYFIGLHAPGSKNMQLSATESLQEYTLWGFLARERPILHKNKRVTLGHWNPAARRNIIERLIKTKKHFKISDYLNAVDHSITRQQALTDLKAAKLHLKGCGRNATWGSR
jgi:hypothetical protein